MNPRLLKIPLMSIMALLLEQDCPLRRIILTWHMNFDSVEMLEKIFEACEPPPNFVENNYDQCPEDPNKKSKGKCGCNVDESEYKTYYYDGDDDDAGDPNNFTQACSQPDKYVLDNSDQCPNNKDKTTPGACGCDINDDSIQPPDVADITVCSGEAAKLIATAKTGIIKWYDNQTSSTPIYTGSTYEFTPSESVSYYVSLNTGGSCESSRKMVSVTVKECELIISDFAINNGDLTTTNQTVELNFSVNSEPTHYIASEKSDFTDAQWIDYTANPDYKLYSEFTEHIVYLKVKNDSAESGVVSDAITLDPKECSISGSIKYSGSETGLLIVDAFDINDTSFEKPVNMGQSYDWQANETQKEFALKLVPAGTYLIRAFIDLNNNNIADSNEPQGTCETPLMCGRSDCQITLQPKCSNKGDVNNDGDITMSDVKETFLLFIGVKSPLPGQTEAADVYPYPSGDGELSMNDVKVLFKIVIGLMSPPDC
jgi:hypothetical protein